MKKTISILIILALVLTTVLVPVSAYAASDSEVSMPKFSKKEGTYTKSVKLTLTAEKGAKIYYTTDGSKPTTKSKVYTEAITIKKTTRVRAIAVKKGVKSKIRSREYTIKVKAPVVDVSVVTKSGKKMYKVTMTPMDSKTTMYYTTDGTKPTKQAKKYTKAIYVDLDDTLRVRSYKSGCTSRTVTVELPKASHTGDKLPEEKPADPKPTEPSNPGNTDFEEGGWKGDDYGSNEDVIGDATVAGEFVDNKDFTREFYKSGMSAEDARQALNRYIYNVYSRKFFADGIKKNQTDEGKFARFVTHSDGRLGINVFQWRDSYDSGSSTNTSLDAVMEAFYFFTKDKDVAYALFSIMDYMNINNSTISEEMVESMGFTIKSQHSGGAVISMNGVDIEWVWAGEEIFYFG